MLKCLFSLSQICNFLPLILSALGLSIYKIDKNNGYKARDGGYMEDSAKRYVKLCGKLKSWK